MPRFKIVKVHSFRIRDKRYSKGEIVELSKEDAEHFKGADLKQLRNSQNLKKRVKKAEQPKFPFFLFSSNFLNVYRNKLSDNKGQKP